MAKGLLDEVLESMPKGGAPDPKPGEGGKPAAGGAGEGGDKKPSVHGYGDEWVKTHGPKKPRT